MVSSCEFFRVIECLRVPVDTSPGPKGCLGHVPGFTVLILSFVVRDSMVGSSAECKRLRPLEDKMVTEEETVLRTHTLLSLAFSKVVQHVGFCSFQKKAIQQVWSLHYNKYNVNRFCVFNFSNSHFFLFISLRLGPHSC